MSKARFAVTFAVCGSKTVNLPFESWLERLNTFAVISMLQPVIEFLEQYTLLLDYDKSEIFLFNSTVQDQGSAYQWLQRITPRVKRLNSSNA